jgi:hypothetical protein
VFLIWDALVSGDEGKTSAAIATLDQKANHVAMGLANKVSRLSF